MVRAQRSLPRESDRAPRGALNSIRPLGRHQRSPENRAARALGSVRRHLARRSLASETAVVEDDRNDSALARAVQALSAVRSLEDLLGLICAQPWLTSDATLRELDGFAGAPEFGLAVARYRDLLAEVRPDPEGAWARFSPWVRESERAAGKLEAVIARVEVPSATQRWDEAIRLAAARLVVAEEHGQAIAVGFLRKVIGSALLQTPSGNTPRTSRWLCRCSSRLRGLPHIRADVPRSSSTSRWHTACVCEEIPREHRAGLRVAHGRARDVRPQ